MHSTDHNTIVCQRIRINGIVQGVGFRPLVWRLAKELELTGWVRNDARGIEIEACGRHDKIEHLLACLHRDAPSLAHIDTITSRFTESLSLSRDFFILDSRGGRAATMIGPDTVICRDCLSDMFDPAGRRWRYAMTSCVHCGPRFTLCDGLPYDRQRTSLAAFPMCPKCQAEYHRAHDRRLHAEANCCPKCGPELALLGGNGMPIAGDAIAQALSLLRGGKILAIKGDGCFHLACDAHNAHAIARLRERKGQHRPLPVMFANALSATPYVQFGVGEPGLLNLPERPTILLRKRAHCDARLPGVAPGQPWLGVMLPSAPVHYLLFHEAAQRPAGLAWLDKAQDLALLMSSGNPAHEPPAIGNEEAQQRLHGIADAFLVHNRDILARCNDSIACSAPSGLQLIRRARGYAPRAVKLEHSGPTVLALGGTQKNTICITRRNEAFVSPHIGDLLNPATFTFFEESIGHLLAMLEVTPTLLAYDMHCDPLLASFVRQMAARKNLPLLAVQHHHAHAAAVLAEHGALRSSLALILDGGQTGNEGHLLGGEILHVDGARFEHLARLAPLRIPYEDARARSPWRLAASVLHALGRRDEISRRFSGHAQAEAIAGRLLSGHDCLDSSAMAVLITAAAGLLGIVSHTEAETQAGLLIEGMAEQFGAVDPLPDGWIIDNGELNLLPLFAFLAEEKNAARGAAIFHATVAAALADWVHRMAPTAKQIVASGGCLQNLVLARELRYRLNRQGMQLIEAKRMPANDGALSLGQAWIAQHYLLGGTDAASHTGATLTPPLPRKGGK